MAWQRVARIDEIQDGEAFPVSVGAAEIALVKLGSRVYGISNICTHEFALMSDGIVEDDCIECPLHQARFDVATGERRSGPACERLATYPTRVDEDGSVLVDSE
jgi:3-phenylpropionate/trans-cinnamate dioxygenase ferredoxin subunit